MGIVDTAFVIGVRKKLPLGQRNTAEIFCGGINAFSRYENGKTKPPLALVKSFKLLDHRLALLVGRPELAGFLVNWNLTPEDTVMQLIDESQ